MCGITGVAGRIGKREETIFQELLVVDSLRGVDSTGIAVVSSQWEVKIAKQVGNPYDLFDTKSYDKALQGLNRVLIGHNRFGTVGVSSRANAHPFQFKHITGVHNGTLKNKYSFINGHEFAVDSQALYNHIAEAGLKSAIITAEGAWALVWWDSNEKTINFLRNSERPLWTVRSEDAKTLFWASELWMLEGILSRNSYKHSKAHLITNDFHYKIVVNDDGSLGSPVLHEYKSVPKTNQVQGTHYPFTYQTGVTSSDIKNSEPKKASRPVLTLANPQKSSYHVPEGHYEFEIIATSKDKFGANYFKLLDWSFNEADIRLYFTRVPFDPDMVIGATITGIVSKVSKTVDGKTYWKVESNSVNWDDVDIDIPVKESVIYDHNNKEIDEVEFYKRYSTCCWCSEPVHPHRKHILTTNGEALCCDCATTPDVTQYISAAGGIRGA